jgi:hypothetical protein
LVNGTLYRYGLKFSWEWYLEYGLLYAMLWQLTLITLTVYTRNLRLFAVLEAFVLSAGQDLIFYLVWVGKFPSTQWTWMPFYQWLGYWTTLSQIVLTVLSVVAVSFLAWKAQTIRNFIF